MVTSSLLYLSHHSYCYVSGMMLSSCEGSSVHLFIAVPVTSQAMLCIWDDVEFVMDSRLFILALPFLSHTSYLLLYF